MQPHVKSNKNDFIDAEAIAEAVTRQNMRFVPSKTDDQLDLQARYRVRDRLVLRPTAPINPIRGFLLERAITFAKGPANLSNPMPAILGTPIRTWHRACVTSSTAFGKSGFRVRSRFTFLDFTEVAQPPSPLRWGG